MFFLLSDSADLAANTLRERLVRPATRNLFYNFLKRVFTNSLFLYSSNAMFLASQSGSNYMLSDSIGYYRLLDQNM